MFFPQDTRCKCTSCQNDPNSPPSDKKIIDLINAIALLETFEINCWRRCEAHNKAVGGAPESRHLVGDACDIACASSEHMYSLVYRAMYLGAKFIEVAPLHLHVDMRDGPNRMITGEG